MNTYTIIFFIVSFLSLILSIYATISIIRTDSEYIPLFGIDTLVICAWICLFNLYALTIASFMVGIAFLTL